MRISDWSSDVCSSDLSELVVIADAFNDYMTRNAQFVERERTFINTASHELRTPVAVINGAAVLALQANADQATMQRQLQRIQRSARDMEQLIVLLLALAKDPARLAGLSKPLALDARLPPLVAAIGRAAVREKGGQ